MAADKLVDSTELEQGLTLVANAIRTKGNTSAQLSFPEGFVQAINNLGSEFIVTRTQNSAGGVTVTISST